MNFEKQRKGENFCQVRKTWITCPLVLSWAACKSFTKSLTVLLRKRTNTVYCSLLLPQNCYISSDLWHLQCICSQHKKTVHGISGGQTDREHCQWWADWSWALPVFPLLIMGCFTNRKIETLNMRDFCSYFCFSCKCCKLLHKIRWLSATQSDKRRNSIYAKNNKR